MVNIVVDTSETVRKTEMTTLGKRPDLWMKPTEDGCKSFCGENTHAHTLHEIQKPRVQPIIKKIVMHLFLYYNYERALRTNDENFN